MRYLLAAALILFSAPAFAARYTVMEHFAAPFTTDAYGSPTDGVVRIDGNWCVDYSGAIADLGTGNYQQKAPNGYTRLLTTTGSNASGSPKGACGGWSAAEWATPQ